MTGVVTIRFKTEGVVGRFTGGAAAAGAVTDLDLAAGLASVR